MEPTLAGASKKADLDERHDHAVFQMDRKAYYEAKTKEILADRKQLKEAFIDEAADPTTGLIVDALADLMSSSDFTRVADSVKTLRGCVKRMAYVRAISAFPFDPATATNAPINQLGEVSCEVCGYYVAENREYFARILGSIRGAADWCTARACPWGKHGQ